MRRRGHGRRHRPRLVDVLEDRGKEFLAKSRAVRVVRGLTFAATADPVRHFFEDHGVADEQLNGVGLVGGNAHRDANQITLALQRSPRALPRDVGAT